MKRNTLILGGVLLLLIAIALLLMQRPGEQSTTGAEGQLLVEIDSAKVDKLEINSSTGKVILEKRGIEWFLHSPIEYRADQSNVNSLIGQAKNLRVKATVSSNPEKQSLFQVDSTGTIVKVYEKGSEKVSFIVGKMGPTFSETYMRLSNSNDVHLIEGSLSYTFSRPVKDWRDRTIANVPHESITNIVYQYGDTTFALSHKDTLWMIGKDGAKESEVNSLLSSLSNFTADNFIDTPPSPAPKFRTTILYGGILLRFAEVKDQSKFVVQSSTSPQLFEVPQWRANQMLKRRKDFVQ